MLIKLPVAGALFKLGSDSRGIDKFPLHEESSSLKSLLA